MNKKLLSLILCILMFMSITTGCTDNKDSEKVKQVSDQTESTSEKVLKLYYFQDYYSINSNALSEFKSLHKDIKVDEKALGIEEVESFKVKFATELMSGEGPDIISLPSFAFPSSGQLMQRELLCDLNPLISKDSDFKVDDYNTSILDVGLSESKRYIIPLDYCINYFYTYKSLLDQNNIKFDTTNWTWDSLVNAMQEYYKEGKGTSKYFFSSLSIHDILATTDSFVDNKNKVSKFNTPEFIKLLKTYKEILPYICPRNEYNNSPEQLAKQCVLQSKFGSFRSVIDSNNFIKDAVGEEAIILPHPTVNGGKSTVATAYNLVGITSKCKVKEEAFDFIKMLMSERSQSLLNNGSPVLKSIFNKQLSEMKNTEKIGLQITDLVQNIKGCTLSDSNVTQIISGELPDFVSGKKSAEQTAKAIDDKVNLFLNE